MRPSILMIEDDVTTAAALQTWLERDGFDVRTVASAEIATSSLTAASRSAIREPLPDLIVLDLNLPGMDGMTFCCNLRQSAVNIPVIMVTGRGEEIDRVVGLETGADDYLVKPVSPRELAARIRAVLRRGQEPAIARNCLSLGDLVIDRNSRSVTVRGQLVRLTQKEFDLLAALAWARGRVLGREVLLEQVWGYDYFGDSRTVDVHINRLRRKIEDDPEHPRYLLTAHGIGYMWAKDVGP